MHAADLLIMLIELVKSGGGHLNPAADSHDEDFQVLRALTYLMVLTQKVRFALTAAWFGGGGRSDR